MQGVVPAAGEGTRMRPLTETKPKGLVTVDGEPLLTHVFETLATVGVTELVVIVGYRGDQIEEYYGETFGEIPITYIRQESRDGLADALVQAAPEIEGTFVLLNGDNVLRGNVEEAAARHHDTDADVTTLVEEAAETAGKGAVFELDGDQISGIVEKPEDPPSSLVPRGFYIFSPTILPACKLVTPDESGEYELTDAIDLLLEAGRSVETVPLDGWCYNVNTPEDRRFVTEKLRSE